MWTYWWAAPTVAAVAALFWACVSRAATQDRPPHQPNPALHEAQHRVRDTGEREVRDA